jgi:hypothetical protein
MNRRLRVLVLVAAIIAALTLVVFVAMWLMHWSMMNGGMMGR